MANVLMAISLWCGFGVHQVMGVSDLQVRQECRKTFVTCMGGEEALKTGAVPTDAKVGECALKAKPLDSGR